MRIIKAKTVEGWGRKHARASSSLMAWLRVVSAADWGNVADVKRTYAAVDTVKVASGRNVLVFNIGGNAFRLIAAAHYNRGIIFALRFLTHAEYDSGRWKDDL